MNLEQDAKIYDPLTLKEYSLYHADGQELLRQLLKSYSLQGGAKKKNTQNEKETKEKETKEKETKETSKKLEAPESDEESESSKDEMFFNKRLPKDYKYRDLSDEIKIFMDTYKKKPRTSLIEYLSSNADSKYKIPSELLKVYKKDILPGPNIESKHIYNPCMPLKWRDDFLPTNKLIKLFFEKHSNSQDISNEMKKILEEENKYHEEVNQPVDKPSIDEILDRLFVVTPVSPFFKLSMDQIAKSVLEIIQEVVASFAILKTPTFNMENEFDKQLVLHYLNHYGDKFHTSILDVYNNIKLAINEAVKSMSKTYKKQNLTEDNIDRHLKVIVVGNNKNYERIMEKIGRFRTFINNKKHEASEINDSGRYEEPIPYYACVKVDILGDEMFTLSGNEGLLYLNDKGEIKQSIKSIMNNPSEKLISFYAKQKRKSSEATVFITDPRSKLDNYYDISLELYIFKLLTNGKLQSK